MQAIFVSIIPAITMNNRIIAEKNIVNCGLNFWKLVTYHTKKPWLFKIFGSKCCYKSASGEYPLVKNIY